MSEPLAPVQGLTPEAEREQYDSVFRFLRDSRARLIKTMLAVEAIDPAARTSLMLRRTIDEDLAAEYVFRGEPLPEDLAKRMKKMNRKGWTWYQGSGDKPNA